MSFIKKIKEDNFITKEELRIFLILLNPLAPHITSEIYESIFNKNIIEESWPSYDSNYLERNTIDMPIQINGKMKQTINVDKSINEQELINKIKEEYPNLISGEIRKIIYIKEKIINIIC